MKPVHIPRSLIILILVLVTVTFLAGTLHAFGSARAATSATPTATLSEPTVSETDLTETPVPTPVLASADTTGIIALASIIVIVVVAGTVLGQIRPRKKKTP